MRSPVRNFIFDLDGTLVDSLPGIEWSVDLALESCGIRKRPLALRAFIGPPIRGILARAAGTSDEPTLDRLEKAFREIYDRAGWRRTRCEKGVRPMLAELQARGCGLWVATNKPALATGRILDNLKLADYFRAVVSPDTRKPAYHSKQEMLSALMAGSGLDAGECLMVGDTRLDAEAAALAGIACALVPHGYGGSGDTPLPPACHRISGWNDLLMWGSIRAAAAAGAPR
jgi:phosphoglycolate phosphatase